jgi:hypothetical protein
MASAFRIIRIILVAHRADSSNQQFFFAVAFAQRRTRVSQSHHVVDVIFLSRAETTRLVHGEQDEVTEEFCRLGHFGRPTNGAFRPN